MREANPDTKGDYGRFWQLYNNRELIIFTHGKRAYEDQLAQCFPYMRRNNALQYCEALVSLFNK